MNEVARARLPSPLIRRWMPLFGVALLLVAAPLRAQGTADADTLALSLPRALAIGQERNPQVEQAAYRRSAAATGAWSAYGALLPRFGFQGQAQRFGAGSFTIVGAEFQTPETYTTVYQWDFTHSLLDAGRDLFRIRSARSLAQRAIATYDLEWWQTRGEIERQYLEARRREALADQTAREIDRRAQHLRLAEARYEVGVVTRSDVLQARLAMSQGEVEQLRARQQAEEARLALRRLLGGALPPAPLRLTSEFMVFPPNYDVEALVAAVPAHPLLREVEAQEEADAAGLWIARSGYLPRLQLQYSLTGNVADTSDFEFSGFDNRDMFAIALNWELFDGFTRHAQISEARASLNATRAESRRRTLSIEESIRGAHGRLTTAYAAYRATATSVELALEDLRLGEGRYETGAGSFVDLLDARVRAAQAETDAIAATYDFLLALVELEQGTGLPLLEDATR